MSGRTSIRAEGDVEVVADGGHGPGWWLASDGRRYPPHLHASVLVGQAPPAYPPGYGPPPGQGPPPGYLPTAHAPAGPLGLLDSVLHQPLAPWWKRLVAALIDGFVMAVPYFVALVVIGAVAGRQTTDPYATPSAPTPAGSIVAGAVILFILLAVPYIVYAGLMSGSRRGQTLGKMALGIAVRDARTGGPIGFGRGMGRYTIAIALELCAVIPYVLDNLSPLWDSRRQAWHDKVVHSVVVDLQP